MAVPEPPDTPVTPPASRPAVLPWFSAYCAVMAAVGLLFLVIGLALHYGGSDAILWHDPAEARFAAAVYTTLGAVFLPLFLIGTCLPRRSFGWTLGIILLALSIPTCCCVPVSLPLLFFWIRPETRAYFGA